ncbi:hypothetical protein BJY00DRAFT_324683 [Aspergillus carlsbadensis]|nr:hypothetical protein BJY00DRAFT_324683 [Aspergillus carlsbadensis]
MYVIAPLSNCASPEKRDRFLEYISAIAPVTLKTEPKCHGYAWFRSAQDNSVVPHHWLRGFEIYEDIKANTETHRASAEYKAFRGAVGPEGLLERPSDLRFWRPLFGFLVHGEPVDFSTLASEQYIVTHEITPNSGKKEDVLGQLRVLAREAEGRQVLSFWVLHRGDEEEDQSLLVFARYKDKSQLIGIENRSETQARWKKVHECCAETRRTTWVASGLGFLGR